MAVIGDQLQQLTDPKVTIDGEQIQYAPSSLKLKIGFGEKEVKAITQGDGLVVPLFCNVTETNLSEVSIEVPNTVQAQQLAQRINIANTQQGRGVAIKILSEKDQFSRVIFAAFLTNEPEWNFGSDAMVSLEFKGSRAL